MGEEQQTHFDAAPLDARIEALLFAQGGAAKRSSLARVLGVSLTELDAAVETLKGRLIGGLSLLETEEAVAIVTSPQVAETVASARKKDWEGELGQAGLEVLAIILHRKEATRSSIDYIRGVNSASTLRILQTKGLTERAPGKEGGSGETLYKVTPVLLAHLGVTHVSDIPNYAKTLAELDQFEYRDKEKAESGAHSEIDDDISYGDDD